MAKATTYRESIIDSIHSIDSKCATGDLEDYDFTNLTKVVRSYGMNSVAALEEAPLEVVLDILADLLTPKAQQSIFTNAER